MANTKKYSEYAPRDAQRRKDVAVGVANSMPPRPCLCGKMIAGNRWKTHQKKCPSARLLG